MLASAIFGREEVEDYLYLYPSYSLGRAAADQLVLGVRLPLPDSAPAAWPVRAGSLPEIEAPLIPCDPASSDLEPHQVHGLQCVSVVARKRMGP